MKKLINNVISLTVIFSLLAMLTSCKKQRSAEDILREFCLAYPIEGEIFVSLSDKDGAYTDRDSITALFGDGFEPPHEYALIINSKINTVTEIAVFIIQSSAQRGHLSEFASERITFLESFLDSEGFMIRRGDVFVYGFIEDKERAVRIFEGIL